MRVNPRYNNTCAMQIGMNRKDPCYDCSKLSECDQHYNEETGEWDYPQLIRPATGKLPTGKHFKKTAKELGGMKSRH